MNLGVLDLISGGSRSTTPTSSLLTRKSPTIDQGTQAGHQQQGGVGKIGEKPSSRTVQPPHRNDRLLKHKIIINNSSLFF